VLADAQLGGVTGTHTLPIGGRPLAVAGLSNWPSRLGFASDTEVIRDLAVVMCPGGICVVPVNAASGQFDPGLLHDGIGVIKTPGGSPQGAVADPPSQLLFVADGTAGLTVLDLAVPGGSRDDDGDGIDDRVLGTVDLNGARATSVAFWRDAVGKLMVAVAAGADGIFIVDPPAPGDGTRCSRLDARGMIVTTIQSDAGWPGARSESFLKCLNYQDGVAVTDDQVIVDFLLNNGVGELFRDLAELLVSRIAGGQAPLSVTIESPNGGGELGVRDGCNSAELDATRGCPVGC
jgi:hypothetical protein